MTPIENLHYAIGELAYAIAMADGKIQKAESEKFQSIVAAELRCKDYNFDISDIIFRLMKKDKIDAETTYKWAMKEIRTNSHYLSPQMKETFIKVMKKVAEAFAPVSPKEQVILDNFFTEIAGINGDPVYYNQK